MSETTDTKVDVTIGGQVYTVPALMKFKAVQRAWPAIKGMQQDGRDAIDVVAMSIRVLSCAAIKAHPKLTPEWIEEELLPAEWDGLLNAIQPILIASGVLKPGEAPPSEEPASPSTEISTGS